MVAKSMNVRDNFLGIRMLATGYRNKPYHSRDKNGKHIPFKEQVEFAAKRWEEDNGKIKELHKKGIHF